MEAVKVASDQLCLDLTKTLALLQALTAISSEKEAAVLSGSIDVLKATTEREEELISEFRLLEKHREKSAGALSKAIGIFDTKVTLTDLLQHVRDMESRQQLTGLKEALDGAVELFFVQNNRLSQLLEQQLDYTAYMLNMLYIPKTNSHTYDVQGARQDTAQGLSLMDLHI